MERRKGPLEATAKSPECRRFPCNAEQSLRDPTGWLGREDSTLRMAESKSTNFLLCIQAHSEKAAGIAPFVINSLVRVSEYE